MKNKKNLDNINNSALNGTLTLGDLDDLNNLDILNNNNFNTKNKNKNSVISNLKLLLGYDKNKGRIFLIMLVLAGFFYSLFFFVSKNAQYVYIDNKLIGAIEGLETLEEDLELLIKNSLADQLGLPVQINSNITLELTRVNKNDFLSQDSIIKNSFDAIDFKVEASCIYVNNQLLAILKTSDEANQILNTIKNSYVSTSMNMTQEPTFVDNIAIKNELVYNSDIISSDEAFDILSGYQNEQKIHTIVQGDTLFALAIENDLTLKEILDANPQLNEDTTLKIDSEINLVVPVPVISVRTYEEITYTATISREVISIPNDDEYKTFSEILVEGSDGVQEITTSIIKVNGIQESENITNEVILIEPIAKQVSVGTLEELPKRALGSFIYPVSGARLSSGFGQRWGTLHKGIDLACSANTPIRASDGGTVVFSGWNSGGYGYMVKIDHENGYETIYAHNTSNAVSVGQKVAQGEIIAYVGSTGDSTGNHVHFEIIKNGANQNPLNHI